MRKTFLLLPRLYFLGAFFIVLSVSASMLKSPQPDMVYVPDLEKLVPETFGSWTVSPLTGLVTPAEWREEDGTATLYRTYKDTDGQYVTLVVAYGAALGDAVRMHQPEVCYKAQGYDILAQTRSRLPVRDIILPLHRMETDNNIHKESVTFWMRAGKSYANGQISQQIVNILSGSSRGASNTLVRLSTTGPLTAEVQLRHDRFVRELLKAAPQELKRIIIVPSHGGSE